MRAAPSIDKEAHDDEDDVALEPSFSAAVTSAVPNIPGDNGEHQPRVAGCRTWLLVAAVAAAAFVAGAEVGIRSAVATPGLVSRLPPASGSPSTALDSSRAQSLQQATAQPCPSAAASAAPLLCPSAPPCAACPSILPCEVASPMPAAASPAAATSPCPAAAGTGSKRAADAVCEADDLREAESLKWGSQHWCPEMDTGGTWAPLDELNVPLVPYGIDTRSDPTVAARIYYGPEGLIHENNAPGGLNVVRQQEPELVRFFRCCIRYQRKRCCLRVSSTCGAVACYTGALKICSQHLYCSALQLKWEWKPAGCSLRNLTRPQVQQMLRGHWIHLGEPAWPALLSRLHACNAHHRQGLMRMQQQATSPGRGC